MITQRKKKMNKIFVKTREQLDDLINDSALTWEGLKMKTNADYKNVTDWMAQFGAKPKTKNVYITKGKTMNALEGLTGSNAYPDDLSIISFKLSEIENAMALAIPRFSVQGRWMDDIVENNRRREER